MYKQMEITIKKTIDREILENIFVTAIECGSTYWYDIPDSEYDKIMEETTKGKSFSERLFEAVYDKGIDVDIYDLENPDDKLGILSKNALQERLQALSESPHNWALEREIEENGDAETSDVVFQYLVMEDIVFG